MSKVPELRFDGFEGEWEEKKLEDSFNVTMGQSPNSKNYTVDSDSLPLIGGNADIKQGKINPSIFTTQITKKSYPGNIIMTVRAPVGDLAMNSSEVVIGRGVCSIDGNNYLYYNLEKKKYENYWRRFISGSTFESINSSDIKSVMISIPENYEQEKIGDLFRKIDDLIEIQEGKVSKMRDYKKSMLQKMFPKKDELVPDFRFDGFDGEWIKIKLEKILKIPNKVPIIIEDYKNIISVRLHTKGAVRNLNSNLSLGSTNYYKRFYGQLIYGKQNIFNGAIALIDKKFDGMASSADIPSLDIVDSDGQFIFTYMSRPIFYKNTEKMSTGTGSKRLHEKDLLNMIAIVPKSRKEQEKIGNFFKNLDTQIENEEKLLDSYKMMKKSLLQKMFV